MSRVPLIFDLNPKDGRLGGFQIGAPISSIINYLKLLNEQIRKVDLIYSQANPLAMQTLINLPQDGIRLKFDSLTQRLAIIEITDISKVVLKMDNMIFSAPNKDLTFVTVQNLLGPALPGYYDQAHQLYVHSYKGFSLFFSIPSREESYVIKILGEGKLPILFPNGMTPVVKKICLYDGHDWSHPQLRNWAPSEARLFQKVIAHLKYGLFFTVENKKIRFGDSAQDVLSELGPPTHVFKKGDVRAIIASGSRKGENSDYFYNYFDRGVDILFDASLHVVKKFILHSNAPGHFDFCRYNKCNFSLLTPYFYQLRASGSTSFLAPEKKSKSKESDLENTENNENTNKQNNSKGNSSSGGSGNVVKSLLVDAPLPSTFHTSSQTNQSDELDPFSEEYFLNIEDNDGESDNFEESTNNGIINPNMKWESIQLIMGHPKGRPVIHNKEVTLNPFDPVHFYGYDGVIFEVMSNNHISSITIYQTN